MPKCTVRAGFLEGGLDWEVTIYRHEPANEGRWVIQNVETLYSTFENMPTVVQETIALLKLTDSDSTTFNQVTELGHRICSNIFWITKFMDGGLSDEDIEGWRKKGSGGRGKYFSYSHRIAKVSKRDSESDQ